jgi:hypothetical protein
MVRMMNVRGCQIRERMCAERASDSYEVRFRVTGVIFIDCFVNAMLYAFQSYKCYTVCSFVLCFDLF